MNHKIEPLGFYILVRPEKDTIEDVYEPYLIQSGFIERTSRGRKATPKAFGHLNIQPPRMQGTES